MQASTRKEVNNLKRVTSVKSVMCHPFPVHMDFPQNRGVYGRPPPGLHLLPKVRRVDKVKYVKGAH